MDDSLLFILVVAAALLLIAALYTTLCVKWHEYCNPPGKFIGGQAKKTSKSKPSKNARSAKHQVKNLVDNPRSRTEAAIIELLEEITGREFPTMYPDWLVWKGHTLELDGWNGDLALEFSGPLHTKWSPSREPYEKYFGRITRDVVKKRLCKKHGVHLIVVDCALPHRHWRAYLLSRLYDFGMLDAQPTDYIAEQTVEPFRNLQLEDELGLTQEWVMANKV